MIKTLKHLEDAHSRMLDALLVNTVHTKTPSQAISEIKSLYMASQYQDCISLARREIFYAPDSINALHRAAMYFYAALASDTWARNMHFKSSELLPLLEQAEDMYQVAMLVLEEQTFTQHALPQTHPQSHGASNHRSAATLVNPEAVALPQSADNALMTIVVTPPKSTAPIAAASLSPQKLTPTAANSNGITTSESTKLLLSTPTQLSPTKRSRLPIYSPSPRRILANSPVKLLETVLEHNCSPLSGPSAAAAAAEKDEQDPFTLKTLGPRDSLAHIPSPVLSMSPPDPLDSPSASPSPPKSPVRRRLAFMPLPTKKKSQSQSTGNDAESWSISAVKVSDKFPSMGASPWHNASLSNEVKTWRNMIGSHVRSVGKFKEKVVGKNRDYGRGRSTWREDGQGNVIDY